LAPARLVVGRTARPGEKAGRWLEAARPSEPNSSDQRMNVRSRASPAAEPDQVAEEISHGSDHKPTWCSVSTPLPPSGERARARRYVDGVMVTPCRGAGSCHAAAPRRGPTARPGTTQREDRFMADIGTRLVDAVGAEHVLAGAEASADVAHD